MIPTRGLGLCACIVGLAATLIAAPAAAQSYESARQGLDFASDAVARSPRLLGMGRLTLLLDDHNNRLTMWDFAGFPTGIVDADSVSTVELRPATGAVSSVRTPFAPPRESFERQDLAAGEIRVGLEAWRREAAGTSAFGLVGDFNLLRVDRPFNDDVERRTEFTFPRLTPVLAGRMPFTSSGATRYALRAHYSLQDDVDQYRFYTRNAAGEYLDRDGVLLGPPEVFSPDERTVSTLGGGVAMSQRLAGGITAGVAIDVLRQEIDGVNEGGRHISESTEERPYAIGQAALIGRLGERVEWGADARAWRSGSEERWAFTLSAGLGGIPLSGRGKKLERDEEGASLRTRARAELGGGFEIAGGLQTGYREIEITPPDPSDRSSFNFFRNALRARSGTDTLALSDSVSHNRSEERRWEAAGGIAWRSGGGRVAIGAELHAFQDRLDQTASGAGPKRVGWDVRGGIEYRCTEALTGRAGYLYRVDDRDDFTERNEYLGHGLTLGLGVRPRGATWSIESGYYFEWLEPDFGDPDESKIGRQQMLAQLRWIF